MSDPEIKEDELEIGLPEDGDKLKKYLADVVDLLSQHSLAMGTILRLVEIKPSSQVETCAILSVGGMPMMFYNPAFVNENCKTKAHLAMLLLHELYHDMLGHIFEDHTLAKNLIGDATINSLICQMYTSNAYQSFFIKVYDAKKMPSCFLRPKGRPPMFWQRRKYAGLYSALGLPFNDLEFVFHEYLEANPEMSKSPLLLGNHSSTGSGGSIPDDLMDGLAQATLESMERPIRKERDKKLNQLNDERRRAESKLHGCNYYGSPKPELSQAEKEELKKKIQDLSDQENVIRSAGLNLSTFAQAITVRLDRAKRRKELEQELRKVAKQSDYSKLESLLKSFFPKLPIVSVIPNFRDRRALVNLVSDTYSPFYKNPFKPDDFGLVTIYIDVSGSMDRFKELVYRVASNCRDYLDPDIYLFSNNVHKISKEELLTGQCFTTGGTDDCWLQHAIENNKRKLMVWTDGYLSVKEALIQKANKMKFKVLAVYTPDHQPLPESIVNSEMVLSDAGEITKPDAKRAGKRDERQRRR